MSLEIRDLSFRYGRRTVLDGIDLTVRPGRLVGLLGANGGGKSTLLHCVCGIRRPVSGHVEVDGADLLSMTPRHRGAVVGYVPQATHTESGLSVYETVLHGTTPVGARRLVTDASARAVRWIDAVGLGEHMMSQLRHLSGGERQRAVIARTLAQETPYVLLDEPVASLDLKHQAQVMAMLHHLTGAGRGVLVVMHDLTLSALWCDEVAVLHEGRVVAHGAPSEVLDAELLGRVYDTPVQVHRVDGRTVTFPGATP